MKVNLEEVFKLDVPLKDFLKMDQDALESFYSTGYHYARSGDNLRAMRYFRLLCMLDPLNPKYKLALAMALHRSGEYTKAAMVYLMTTINNPIDPTPWFYLYDCYTHLNDSLGAYTSLQIVIKLASEDPNYLPYKQKAEIILSKLE